MRTDSVLLNERRVEEVEELPALRRTKLFLNSRQAPTATADTALTHFTRQKKAAIVARLQILRARLYGKTNCTAGVPQFTI